MTPQRIIRHLNSLHQPVILHIPHPGLSLTQSHDQPLVTQHSLDQRRVPADDFVATRVRVNDVLVGGVTHCNPRIFVLQGQLEERLVGYEYGFGDCEGFDGGVDGEESDVAIVAGCDDVVQRAFGGFVVDLVDDCWKVVG